MPHVKLVSDMNSYMLFKMLRIYNSKILDLKLSIYPRTGSSTEIRNNENSSRFELDQEICVVKHYSGLK